MHQSVIEAGTRVCRNIREAKAEIQMIRRSLIDLAKQNGLRLAAAASHPFAKWSEQGIYPDERYHTIVEDMQMVARANLIFGLHVHIGVEDPETAIHIMNAARYFLPHILALSTNSPFWRGMDTGLKSYRCKVFDKFPRTNIPDYFPAMANTRASSTCSFAPIASITPRKSGGISGHTPISARSNFACATSPCAPRRPSRWPRSSRPPWPSSTSCTP
jgi:YbdK family carboxylate-amine ligase